ncbi:MAG: DegT/DnrJ/EryC1/StrS family aminotransferase [Paludibacteraceae bacterium]|nr:DegT/DnrJ/EryC1/StrS family aminotransferase [Paludibacteraceae bacterium]
MEYKKISFSPPDMGAEEVEMVKEAILSGWITTGPKTKEFEKKIAEFCGTNKTVCLSSATAALEMALKLIGVTKGDEVIVPAYTFTASASVVDHVKAKIVMVDSQTNSVEMDYEQLEKAITPRTKVIIPVDLGGVVADYNKIFEIVERQRKLFRAKTDVQRFFGRVAVLADAAHAFGAMRYGKMCGSIADFTAFSFHAVKNLTTAEGGALTWREFPGMDSEDLYRQCQLYSLHGQSKDALAKSHAGSWEYDVIGPWYKCNMTDITAGIGLAQLKRYAEMTKKRHAMIEKYNKAFKGLNVNIMQHTGKDFKSSGHLYMVRLNGKSWEERNKVIEMMGDRGIACNVHYKPLPMMTAYKKMGFDIKDYPNAYHLFENEITLPLYTKLTEEDLQYIIENFIEVMKSI